jgi:hypothetical protein
MKRQQILEVLGYGFVALVFITIFTWIFHIFMAPRNQYDGFENLGGQCPQKDRQNVVDISPSLQRPYVTSELNMGDFEGDFDRTMIGKFEGGIEATKDVQNLALRQYPFDWANAPPSSKIFQEQNALFLEKQNLLRNAEELPTGSSGSGSGSGLHGQNERALPNYQREGFGDLGPADEVIKKYKPKCAKATKTSSNAFSEDDSENFILDYYDKLGLVPEFKRRDDGVYEVISTYEKNPKITYEDDGSVPKRDVWKPMAGNDEITVNANYGKELSAVSTNPQLASKEQTGLQKNDPRSLDRIFGPGLQWQQYG